MKNFVECTTSDIDFFTEPPYENVIRDGQYNKIEPTVKSDKQIIFDIPPNPKFLDLSKSSIVIKIKITTDEGAELTDASPVGPVNNTFHSIIRQATVFINNTEIENSDDGYFMRAITSAILNHGIDAKNSFLQNSLYIPDTPGQMENFAIPKEITKAEDIKYPVPLYNKGFLKRREILLKGKGFLELRGVPECDIFTNGKFLLNQQKFTLNLKLNDPVSFLMGEGKYKMTVISAHFWAKQVTPNDNILNSVALNLEKRFAVYNTNKVTANVIKLKLEGRAETVNIVSGILPKRAVFALVDFEASGVGQINKNPYFFHHFDMKGFDLRENGSTSPHSHALEFNFDQNEYLDGYWSLFEGIDKPFLGNCISREDYANGYTFLAFDMTPNGECEPFQPVTKNGTLTARITVGKVPTTAVGLFCYLEYNETIRFDKERNVVKLT